MANLIRAHEELFRRSPDETFPSLQSLLAHSVEKRSRSTDRWLAPRTLEPRASDGQVTLGLGDGASLKLNDWSFTQLCSLARASKDTVNRLTPETASLVLSETLPQTQKPVQLLITEDAVRSVHGVVYTRLHDSDLVSMLSEFAVDFGAPPVGLDGKTGLYSGEQDMFAFLIDPTGWAEIGGEAFAPGFFVWNSEVGKRSVGIQTFWFQAVCRNHIVWDAAEVSEFTRKHTGKVGEALSDIRRIVEALVSRRDERRDGFVNTIRRAMETKLGDDADEVLKTLTARGFTRTLANRAIEIARSQGRLTIFSVVDALTRLAGENQNAGDRSELDQKAGSLLALVARGE